MNSWKFLVLNACVTAVLIAAGITLLLPAMQGQEPPFAGALSRKTAAIEERLARMEKMLAPRESAPAPTQGHAPLGDTREISAKLDAILARLSSIEAKAGSAPRPGMRGMPMPAPPGMSERGREGGPEGGPASWIDNLPKEKQEAVRQIFRENSRMARERYGAEREEGRATIERMREIRQEREAFLKERLQEVLTDEEYQSYLDSLPEAAAEKMEMPNLLREPPVERPRTDTR